MERNIFLIFYAKGVDNMYLVQYNFDRQTDRIGLSFFAALKQNIHYI